jgi:peptidoglycan/xylan/chitin deacetylase (PgdA/CDA1 family)
MYPETIKRMTAEGNVVENHSYLHNPNHALTTEGCKDLKIGEETIFKITGLKPHLYRPPHGRKTPWEFECLEKENLIEVEWSASTNELHSKLFFGKISPALLEKNIIKEAGAGKIILLHDGYGTCHNCKESDKTATVEALSTIIETLKSEGYKFVTVAELLGVSPYNN